MTLDRDVLSFLGRRYEAAWLQTGAIALNPQPIPPIVELNPQPLPPGPPPEILGALNARLVLQLAWSADKLGVEVRPLTEWDDDDICPVYPKIPPIPPGVPPVPGPGDPPPGPDWHRAYVIAFASVLASVEGRLSESGVVISGLEQAERSFASVAG